MEYTNLGRYGVKVSRLSLGAMMFGGPTDEAESTRKHISVFDGASWSMLRPGQELPDAEIEAYLERNMAVLRRLLNDHGIEAVHANHAVLLSVVAERVCAESGLPFAIMLGITAFMTGNAIQANTVADSRTSASASGSSGRSRASTKRSAPSTPTSEAMAATVSG